MGLKDERLHKDYQIINQYVIDKYQLKNDLTIPADFKDEAINQICSFDTEELIQDMDSYFLPVDEEPIFFFTKEMADEFIGEAVEFCVEEVEKLRDGKPRIDMMIYAWNRAGV